MSVLLDPTPAARSVNGRLSLRPGEEVYGAAGDAKQGASQDFYNAIKNSSPFTQQWLGLSNEWVRQFLQPYAFKRRKPSESTGRSSLKIPLLEDEKQFFGSGLGIPD